ncbi:hypothetical protein B6I21_03265 [candidate division KSB1 bacterium 4572_119]|nr:MAG: hypothetical protein B6I21_03265 [candidate division KSB1 bacterium 4572_119]
MKNILVAVFLVIVCIFFYAGMTAASTLLYGSLHQFNGTLDSLANIEEASIRDSVINIFWNELKNDQKIPFVIDDSVAFLYKGSANSVSWAGDFSGWNPSVTAYKGKKVGLTNIWRVVASFPINARLDYKIVVNNNWILDPANPHQQWSGFGPNSELRMPEWIIPIETIRRPDVPRGSFSSNINIYSVPLAYSTNYRVYTPAGYDSLQNLPVVYVTDGHEYADDRLGSMLIVLDNLIADNLIEPVVVVFIDPRQPSNLSNNRRAEQYTMNENFASFVADELVPQIDANYKTNPNPEKRAILGTSLGGINSAYFGITRPDKFRCIAIQSPAFHHKPQIYSLYSDSTTLPLSVFMSTGVIHDTESAARQMKQIMENKEYPLKYIEVNEGHSWGNWRALLDDMLIYFFGETTSIKRSENVQPDKSFFQLNNYPNPFNPATSICFFLPESQRVTLEVFNVLGQKIISMINNEYLSSGFHSVNFNGGGKSSGIYYYRLSNLNEFQSGKMLYVN